MEALVGRFVATTMYGACVPERFFCAPEQPEWDALTELDAAPIVAPSGNLGVKWTPHRAWRLGAAFQLPWWVRAPATVRTRLPATPAFESAFQEGDSADVSFELPWALRLGVELRPIFEFSRTGTGPQGQVLGDYRATGYLPSFLQTFIVMGLVKKGEPYL